MAKDKEKAAARQYFVRLGKTQKEIAQLVHVSERQISVWAREGKWAAERDARLNSTYERAEAIKLVIENITARRLEVFEEIKAAKESGDKVLHAQLLKESVTLSQDVAMQTKALEKMERDTRISLAVYIEVMDDVFKGLQAFDGALYMKTLDFQESHLSTISMKLG